MYPGKLDDNIDIAEMPFNPTSKRSKRIATGGEEDEKLQWVKEIIHEGVRKAGQLSLG